jgi:cholinesterase
MVEASEFGATCIPNIEISPNRTITYDGGFKKTLSGVLGQLGNSYDEDCLTLNIWTKPNSNPSTSYNSPFVNSSRKKAVMIWLYGGGFGSGNTNSPMYNGARLADEQDVLVVSVNYRLNIFGFPRAPFLEDKNLGLLDQRLATVWVRDK